MLRKHIKSLDLPKLLEFEDGTPVKTPSDWKRRRAEILHILSKEQYGLRPPEPAMVSAMTQRIKENAYAGKVREEHLTLSAQIEDDIFSFPLKTFIPKSVENPMVIVYIAFRPDVPDRYLPIEEITDHGFAVATFCHDDVALDREDKFVGGLAGLLKKEERTKDATGKLMMWAWAASRVVDYLEGVEGIDHENIAVMGHSRLGKTSLIAAAYDERFTFTFPNNSGCSGDAITRGKKGERVEQITRSFPFWFCPNYRKYAGCEMDMPFDQHFLIAAIAPRFVCAGTAKEDTWADPNSQYLSYVAASKVYKLLGADGFIHPDRFPEPEDVFHEGTLGFHMRPGEHFHSRYDWLQYMSFMKKNRR